MTKEQEMTLTCISCPVGCRMTVRLQGGEVLSVEGNQCKRGDIYARQESVQPRRMLTAVASVAGSAVPVSLKTADPVPKDKIDQVMAEVRAMRLTLPIQMGQVLLHNVAETDVDLIATRSLP